MTFGTNLYQGRHRTQFDSGPYQSSNCVPASLADAADAVSGGAINRTPSQVRSLVKTSEEQNPDTPGWTMQDAKLAASRLGISFTPASGPWSAVESLRIEGRFVLVQGDSGRFQDGCSANFDGAHCIGLPPLNHSDGRWRVGDPICSDWRWESSKTLREYGQMFTGSSNVSYGFTDPVPVLDDSTGTGDDAVTSVLPVTVATGHVSSAGPVTIYVPDGSAKKTVTLDAVKADVTEYAINQSDGRAPKGGPWRRLAESPHAGYYVPSASVTWTPPPPTAGDVVHTVTLAVDGAKKAEVKV